MNNMGYKHNEIEQFIHDKTNQKKRTPEEPPVVISLEKLQLASAEPTNDNSEKDQLDTKWKERKRSCIQFAIAFATAFAIAFALCLLIAGILVACGFSAVVKLVIDHQIALRPEGQAYGWWVKPPLEPIFKVYVYNVTNADEFLNNASKPLLDELGPYVYAETLEKVNLVHHRNGTISFNLKRVFQFREDLSLGMEDDVVIVPNIPILSLTSQSKFVARYFRLSIASLMDILKIKPFVEVSVGQLLWGYEDPLHKLVRYDSPKNQKFGILYGKNQTSVDTLTVFSGVDDISKFGVIDRWNGMSQLSHWTTEECNRINGSDGSIFPPHMNHDTILHVFDKDLCRLLPLKFEKEVDTANGVKGFRFRPPENVFADVETNPDNMCFCPAGPPCAPNGTFNVSLCQFDSPVMLSFPHFYLGDDNLRTAVDGISPPEKEKHGFFVDVQPDMGTSLRAKARLQINLAVSQVVDIKQVASFPDIVFPIVWFEEGVDALPEEVTNLMNLATNVPPKARVVLMILLFVLGAILLVMAVFCLIRNSHRQSTLHLEGSNYLATTAIDLERKMAKEMKK